MFIKFIIAAASAAGCAPACLPAPTEPACVENFGPGVVQIKYENELGCDLNPPQTLTVVFDAKSYGEGWGGDTSLAWADGECLDMGGTPIWHDGTWLECADRDY